MRLMEHGSPLDIIPFPFLPVLDSETVFEVTIDPHFTDNVTVQREI
jgi:hypothetical protein